MWIHTFRITFKTFFYRSGVYCAANACIEQVIQHGEVIIEFAHNNLLSLS